MPDYVVDGTRHANFCIDQLRVSIPQIRDFAAIFGVTVVFFGFFNKATAYTPKRMFTQSTSEHVVPGKEVIFWQSR